ncbi:hypothetical protein GO986_06865 [Deinococcus sp. HMF7620]|uniref:Uncharacterized protein n=1 Tax=Deinococcus arboris TaxID=2682977 RepID=A0A7C9MQH3_9DEIO|nr:hypothetical protein [Deinococcus arboris]MVN86484.1 hypothetical protein [Deinococcus arboris]
MSAEPRPDTELAGLPAWLYPLGFWVGVVLLALGLLVPSAVWVGVVWVAAVPVLAALWVALSGWRTDRRLSVAALLALAGLGLVVMVRQLL